LQYETPLYNLYSSKLTILRIICFLDCLS